MSYTNYSDAINIQISNLFLSNKIGAGSSREVWDSNILKDCVIKVEQYAESFQNIMEWEIWKDVKGTYFEKFFAPCEWISPNGRVLIMKKTSMPHKYPDKLPKFLTDTKKNNYGMYNKKFVCHDYGLTTLLTFGLTKLERKVQWREE